MPEFPTEEALLGEMVSLQPDTIERQNAMAQFLVAFAKTHGLGDARLVPFPEDATHGKHNPQRYNVSITLPCTSGEPEEVLGIYGHIDIVKPSEFYKKEHLGQLRSGKEGYQWMGPGAGDMMIGNEAIFFFLHEIERGNYQVWPHREIRVILPCGEEASSEGFHAAKRSGLFDGVTCLITPEVLTSGQDVDHETTLYLNEGRPGRYGFTVRAKTLEKHVGAVRPEDDPYLAAALDVLMKRVIHELNDVLVPNPDISGGLELHPKALPLSWGVKVQPSLTTPWQAWVFANVHYAHHQDSPEEVMKWVHQRLRELGTPIFGSEEVAAETFSVEREIHGSDKDNTTPFTPPWKENHDHLFLRTMREEIMPAAIAACDSSRYPEGKPSNVKSVVDTGVADCGLIANEGIVVAGVLPRVWGIHTAFETVDIRTREYITNVLLKAATTERILAPRDVSL